MRHSTLYFVPNPQKVRGTLKNIAAILHRINPKSNSSTLNPSPASQLELMKLTAYLAAALILTLPAPSATIPAATGTALDGHTVTLPKNLSAPATLLILGFSHKSADTTTAWEKPIRTTLAGPRIDYYDMPFLQDAPSFIRPLILRSIRKQVPDVLKPHFVPLTANESAWKQVANFTPSAPDAAYVLLIDRNGTIRWQTHEPFTPARFNELSSATRQLANASH